MNLLTAAETRDNARLKQLNERIVMNYNAALAKTMRRYKTAFRQVELIESGKLTPPAGVDPEKWKREQINKVIQKAGVAQGLARDLAEAGQHSNVSIKKVLAQGYADQYEAAAGTIQAEAADVGINYSFAQIDKRTIDVLMRQDANRPFTRLAYARSEDAESIADRLANEFTQAALAGEGRDDLLKRIRKVVGKQAGRAERIAQTEHTRIQSEARWNAGKDAAAKGVGVYNEWRCKMMETSRDTHKELDGQKRMQGAEFTLSDGDHLRFPGDPFGRACNTINCYCVLIPHVLLPGERL